MATRLSACLMRTARGGCRIASRRTFRYTPSSGPGCYRSKLRKQELPQVELPVRFE